jgi:drug/metabolite transporter (DMT)-like permease
VAAIFRRRLLWLSREGWLAGAVMGVFLTGGYIFQTLGLEETTVSNAGFITGLFVVLTPVLGAVFLKERVPALAGHLEKPEGATVWSALIVTSLVASALGFFVQSFAQRHAPPARTALILTSEPAFARLFGWLLNDERLTAAGWLGAGLIMTPIVAVELVPRFRPPRPLPEG